MARRDGQPEEPRAGAREAPPASSGADDRKPPCIATWLLARCLPAGVVGRSILGDLDEEYQQACATRFGPAARLWYLRQAAKLGVRYAWERAHRRLRPRRRGAPRAPRERSSKMEDLVQDLRFGARMLRANPGFSLVAVLTLALGVGANTAMFSVVNGILLRPLDFPEPERLVAIQRFDIAAGTVRDNTTPGNFIAWRERATSFDAMAALSGDVAALTGSGEATRVTGLRSAGSLLEVLATPPLFGRILSAADDAAGARVVVLSYELWQRLFGDDPNLLGRSVVLDEVPYAVVGVMPEGFGFRYFSGTEVDFWTPSGWSAEYRMDHGNYAHEVIARLAPGVSIERAQEEMEAIAAELRREYPEANRDHGVLLVPLQESLVAGIDDLLFLLMGAVGFVLVIATVNLANLLLARAGARGSEIGVRRAIGATSWRLARQLLTESLLLALLGGALGIGMAWLTIDLLTAMIPADVAYLARVTIDTTVLAFALAAALAAGVAFGLFPAMRLSRQEPSSSLDGGRGAERTTWGWNALVVAEVGLSVVLLVGAGLLLRSFVNLVRVDPGFRPEGVMTFTVALPEGYPPERRLATWRQLREELAALPGVSAAAAANQLPSEPNRVSGWLNYADRPIVYHDRSFLIPYRLVSPGYFEALGIPVVQGRAFTGRDESGPLAAVVNEAAARLFWPDTDPVGDNITMGSFEGAPWYPPATVVGVVGDVRNDGIAMAPVPAVYFPLRVASGWSNMTFALRTGGEPGAVLGAAREAVRRVAPAAPLFGERTAEQALATQRAPTRAVLQIIGVFAALGLAMAAIGVFGVLSYSVSRRRREIGIRSALGADRLRLTSMVVTQAMGRVLAGTAAGIAVSAAATRYLESRLYDVTPLDPLTLVGVTVLLAGVALLASWLPARRAAAVDPTTALR